MPNFIPTDEQWEKMKKHIKSDNYKKEDFFVFETLAVGDRIVPNRYMRLTPSLLSVMKDDAQKDIEQSTLDAKDAIRKEMVNLALSASSEILKREINEKDNARLAEEFIRSIED